MLLVPQLVLSAWRTPTVTPPFRYHVSLMPVFLLMTSRTRKLEKMQASILVAFLIHVTKYLTKITLQERNSLWLIVERF